LYIIWPVLLGIQWHQPCRTQCTSINLHNVVGKKYFELALKCFQTKHVNVSFLNSCLNIQNWWRSGLKIYGRINFISNHKNIGTSLYTTSIQILLAKWLKSLPASWWFHVLKLVIDIQNRINNNQWENKILGGVWWVNWQRKT
jgi:hypothetical protein